MIIQEINKWKEPYKYYILYIRYTHIHAVEQLTGVNIWQPYLSINHLPILEICHTYSGDSNEWSLSTTQLLKSRHNSQKLSMICQF